MEINLEQSQSNPQSQAQAQYRDQADSQLPDNERDLIRRIDEINKEIDEQEILNKKLQDQINNIKVGMNDLSKKRISLVTETHGKSKKGLNMLIVLIIVMFGLMLGAYINK